MDGKQFRIGSGGSGGKKNRFKNAGFIALLVLFGLILFAALNQPSNLKSVPFSQVVDRQISGELKKIVVNGEELEITPKGQDKATEKSFKEPGSSIYEQGLKQGKVELENKPQSDRVIFG
jgi:hypothetical protein